MRAANTEGDAKLLSLAAAAKFLGISRNTTLGELIRTGQLRTVRVGQRVKVSLGEVKRLAQGRAQ
jgi:excisionase family DNA binding protein